MLCFVTDVYNCVNLHITNRGSQIIVHYCSIVFTVWHYMNLYHLRYDVTGTLLSG